MSAGNRGPAVDVATGGPLRIDCYTRRTAHPAVTDSITEVVERVRGLAEAGRIATARVTCWPPASHAVDRADGDDAAAATRRELVAEFERWAAEQGHSLEPAFRRREIRLSPLGLDGAEPRERIRVPLVALAVREAETGCLRGVVPYTERPGTDEERTYTVGEWLSAVGATDSDRATARLADDRPTPLGGWQ